MSSEPLTDWFLDSKRIKIKIIGANELPDNDNKKYYLLLQNVVVDGAQKCFRSQYFGRHDQKISDGKPVGNIYFSFTVSQAKISLRNAGRSPGYWDGLEPSSRVKVISSVCEIIE